MTTITPPPPASPSPPVPLAAEDPAAPLDDQARTAALVAEPAPGPAPEPGPEPTPEAEPGGRASESAPAMAGEWRIYPLTFHPDAELFPLMNEQALKELIEDIGGSGQRVPILIDSKDRIIDGRNRYRACLALGIQPLMRDWDGDGYVIDVIVSLNLHRRHLDASQRAMIAARLASRKRGGQEMNASNDAFSQPRAAELLSVSRMSVQRATNVLRSGAPELVTAVDRGEITVANAAQMVLQLPKSVQSAMFAAASAAAIALARRASPSRRRRHAAPRQEPSTDWGVIESMLRYVPMLRANLTPSQAVASCPMVKWRETAELAEMATAWFAQFTCLLQESLAAHPAPPRQPSSPAAAP